MKTELESLINYYPKEVKWNDVVEFHRMDERISSVGVLFVNIIGVNEGYIEFCPDPNPPTEEEILSWIWVIRPDLGNLILDKELSSNFRMLIESYQSDKMDIWWEHITK